MWRYLFVAVAQEGGQAAWARHSPIKGSSRGNGNYLMIYLTRIPGCGCSEDPVC
jgi:hypothetical protein